MHCGKILFFETSSPHLIVVDNHYKWGELVSKALYPIKSHESKYFPVLSSFFHFYLERKGVLFSFIYCPRKNRFCLKKPNIGGCHCFSPNCNKMKYTGITKWLAKLVFTHILTN